MIKVGIVGAGYIGKRHAEVYQIHPQAELVAVCDLEEEKAKEILPQGKIYTKLEDMLNNPDINLVDICLPTYLHKEAVIKSLEAGKHVLCEKPIALNLEDAEEMVEKAESSDTFFMVAHCLRFWPEYEVLKKMVEKGDRGEVIHASFRRIGSLPIWSWGGWVLQESKSGGALIDFHIHDVDFVLYLLGKPEKIYARGVRNEFGWSHVYSLYTYKDKAVFLEAGWDYPPGFPFAHSYLVCLEKGTLEFSPQKTPSLIFYPQEGGTEYPSPLQEELKVSAGGNIEKIAAYYKEIDYFLTCIQKGEKPVLITPQSARDALYLVLKEKESIETGKVVEVDG
ncbi:MAG TPA: Gfo/Idh/MocA family oxidoreductase [Candidatus Aerophobetes bacterium]|uniref:Gfo/Idh/MocA family oxidoreductase n=1 Tax=Aerophobetes bacterium TaxID=2030807 RepID=A0A7V0QQX0_UNCAE|nr:Gfo/Idh/MocA family oxidoreductase [Candidatus Aerophobetes bacterium]